MLKTAFKVGMVMGMVLVMAGQSARAMEPSQEGGVKGLAERVAHVESALEKIGVSLSGAIEVEAAYTDDDRESGESSDITLSKVELGVDVSPLRHVRGHVLLLFEEDATDPLDVDEAFIHIDSGENRHLFVQAGRQYVPFGYFESHFISDPPTLELGETRETAVVAGYAGDAFEISLGGFNGDVKETGDEVDHIDGYVAGATCTLPQNDAFALMAGVSYISNIGESDNLRGEDGIDVDGGSTVADKVPGLAAFISVGFKEKLFVELEYVTATDEFKAGELGFDGGLAAQPSAYNVEVAYAFTRRLEGGIRFAGAQDAGAFLPETQYGAVATYAVYDNLSLGLEYQYGEFDTVEETEITTVTAQLALGF